ncbi:MAG: hypothetical protein Q9222_007069 [Ikaeria aurantiellina]
MYQTATFSRFVRDQGDPLSNTPHLDGLERRSLPSADNLHPVDHEFENLAATRGMFLLRLLSQTAIFPDLTPSQHLERNAILTDYRTSRFVTDLALGRHDGFVAAYQNQEYDSYYTDLWNRIAKCSTAAAIALGEERLNPHEPPAIALTIPPLYEVSDVPPYTETVLPPSYTVEVLKDHVSRDVPHCINPACPVRQLGIPHSRGLYHHEGQLGPFKRGGSTWLPTFGCSNPPPHVWDAYNHLVLGIASASQTEMVVAFITCHSRPWTPHWKSRATIAEGEVKVNWVKKADGVGWDDVRDAENRGRVPRCIYTRSRNSPAVPDSENDARATRARFVETVDTVLANRRRQAVSDPANATARQDTPAANMSGAQLEQVTRFENAGQQWVRIPSGTPANVATGRARYAAAAAAAASRNLDRGRAIYSEHAARQYRAHILGLAHRQDTAPTPSSNQATAAAAASTPFPFPTTATTTPPQAAITPSPAESSGTQQVPTTEPHTDNTWDISLASELPFEALWTNGDWREDQETRYWRRLMGFEDWW